MDTSKKRLLLLKLFGLVLYKVNLDCSNVRLLRCNEEQSGFEFLRRSILEASSKIPDEQDLALSLSCLGNKKTEFQRVGNDIWVNSPFFETFVILKNPQSQEVNLLRYDSFLPFRSVLRHPLLEHKTFSILKFLKKPPSQYNSDKKQLPLREGSLLLFHDPKEVCGKINNFLDQIGVSRDAVARSGLGPNPMGVKMVLYFDQRFVCVFRETLEGGGRRRTQFVDVFDKVSQQIVFQSASSDSHQITHVQVLKIEKTLEYQLFIGMINKGHEGHARAEWKIYRVIKKRTSPQK